MDLQEGSHVAEVEKIGAKLSKVIDCPVRYPAYDKNIFACHCGITFPVFVVKAAYDSDNWSDVLKIHKEGR